MSATEFTPPAYLDRIVQFPEHTSSYELLQPLTDFRMCHDGTPLESRILFNCRKTSVNSGESNMETFVMKVKVQAPGPASPDGQRVDKGPSTTTSAELEALERFRKAGNPSTPHLVSWKRVEQGDDGPLPGGFITYCLMTKVPGANLLDLKYLQLPEEEREEIKRRFTEALRSIHQLGIEPIDRGLRNILWETKTKKCSIIDFELWRETENTPSENDLEKELQRWGLAKMPPTRDFFSAFYQNMR